jgi:hypothetical protein
MSEYDKIRSRLSSAIEKIKKLSEERGDLDLDQARMATHLAQDELDYLHLKICTKRVKFYLKV